ncbi:uncharacterized protein SCHCODRAFT_02492394 [Schizophyllum commune H4-8]|uniref:Expressed protein n=1 Tax=Schizophyllum commune (strain H4-8 / FGSC 9210) TaxID=578458 RepID=D8PZN7_SCHCM|nr:uncharacterized protein SCHCODRAFT_02492394 [Schizophyllum commune H4-8]KAI5896454.1 hypothetical protein SCHCODRAFT_02492394 [Schizophyllum commune H4-8]
MAHREEKELREEIQREKSGPSAVENDSSSDDEPLGEVTRGRSRAATIRAQTPAPPGQESRQGRRR